MECRHCFRNQRRNKKKKKKKRGPIVQNHGAKRRARSRHKPLDDGLNRGGEVEEEKRSAYRDIIEAHKKKKKKS